MRLLSAIVVLFSAFLILFTPLRPKVTFVEPELKLINSPTPSNNLQSYYNPKFKFQFQYPLGWSISGDTITTSNRNYIHIVITPDSSKTIAEFLAKQDKISSTAWEGQPSKEIRSTRKTIINKLNCIQRDEYIFAKDGPQTTTYFKNGSNFIAFIYDPAPGNNPALDIDGYNQLLKTLKFVGDDFRSVTGILQKGTSADLECGYTYLIKPDPPINDEIYYGGGGFMPKLIPLIGSNLDAYLNQKIEVTGDVEWGCSESKHLTVGSIQLSNK